MRIADLGLDSRIVEILKGQGIEELYPPQADAIGPALLGENLVLAIPTASGVIWSKSLPASTNVIQNHETPAAAHKRHRRLDSGSVGRAAGGLETRATSRF